MTAGTTRADHAELARLAEAATRGDWRAHITTKRSPEIYTNVPPPNTPNPKIAAGILRKADARFIAAANPATVLSLLSEIAALRGERDGLKNRVSCLERLGGEQSTRVMEQATRAKDAERQRDKLRESMPDLSSVIAWLDNGCEPKHAVTELSIYKARIDQALANQGADQ